jgi:hypothetical protein
VPGTHRAQELSQNLTTLKMKMQIIMAVLSLALLMWAETASAQKTYSASVSVHHTLPELTADQVKKILTDASKLLQKDPRHSETDDDVKCNVTFTLKGAVGTFGAEDTPAIVGRSDLDAVHRVRSGADGDFHVKVVNKILNFCRFPGSAGFNGCAFPPNFRSIIVVHPKMHIDRLGRPLATFPDHRLWAHEFGHLTGLGHRDDLRALMTSCPLDEQFSELPDDAQVQVTRDECSCLQWGPGFGPNGTCEMRGPTRCSR